MQEIWKPIKNYEEYYEISNHGNVRRIKYDNKGNLKQYPLPNYIKNKIDKDGYKRYTLSLKSKNKEFSSHRLVAQAFIPNPNNYPVVNHKDGDKNNNNIDNLEWCSIQHNNIHALENKLRVMPMGNDLKTSKSVLKFDKDGNFIEKYESSGDASRKNGILSSHIRDCCRGSLKTYKGYVWKYEVK